MHTTREETADTRWARALLYFDSKAYADAAVMLSELVAEVPEQVGPRLLLARAYYHSAQLRRAEEQLREVIARDPVEQYAHLMLGRALERQGRAAEAAPYLRLAAVLGGDFPEA